MVHTKAYFVFVAVRFVLRLLHIGYFGPIAKDII